MEWDDLRYVLAVARTGSLSGAARTLAVNHSTVFRRIELLEKRLAVRLFERHRGGYAPTLAGEEMQRIAAQVEEEITALDRRITGADLRLSGTIRLTSTDTFAHILLLPHLQRFRESYPGIELDLVVTGTNVNLTRRDADVALRATGTPPEELIGRRVASIAFAVYGATRWRKRAKRESLESLPWVGFEESIAGITAARLMRTHFPQATPAVRGTSLLTLAQFAGVGAGLAVLPCFVGDRTRGLVRYSERLEGHDQGLWLLTHADLRDTARIKTFMEFFASSLASEKELVEGRGPASSRELERRLRRA
jgi:DNA-binding transcriptional LysR family regulator